MVIAVNSDILLLLNLFDCVFLLLDVNSWMTNPIEADKMLGGSEIIFPVQYNDYHHQCEKWNFVKGLPEVNPH